MDVKKTFLEKVDFFFNKVIPKKFLVWIVATILVFMKILPGDMWAYISMVYLGVNVIQKGADIFKKAPKEKEVGCVEKN